MPPVAGFSFPALSRRAFAGSLLCVLARPLAAQQRPRRIVSTAPSITEALFALGLGDQVVGVSRFCDFPPQVAKLPKVGTYLKPDLEAIARLTPDLVVLETAPPDLTDRLKALRISYVEIPHGTLADVYTGIQIIAKAAAVPSQPLVDRIQNALHSIQTRSAATGPVRIIAILSRKEGTLTDLTAVGPDNYVNEILTIAGGTNLLAKPGLPHYPHIALETIIREDPDVIVDLTHSADTEATRQADRSTILALWGQNRTLKAVRSGRIYFGTSNALVVPGPRSPEAAQMLFDAMHGGRS